jgi:two-component system, NarL family, sensor histidine kinase DesK
MSGEDRTDLRLGARPRAGWLWAGVWLVYLTIPLGEDFDRRYAVWQQVVGMAGLCVFAYAYIRMTNRSRAEWEQDYLPWNADRSLRVYLAVMAALALVLPIVSTPLWVALWIYVASACGSVLPFEGERRWALIAGLGVTCIMVLEAVLLGASVGSWGWMVLPGFFSCVAVIGVRRMRGLIGELHRAREEVKHLAASEERLRLARDLHDLAGHSMATITLKAELARRLIPGDPAAAEKQVADIEQVSRQALADIREAVSGYRRATLAVETVSARTALEAAQIAFEHDSALLNRSGTLDPEAEAALAWCLREAVTNVVRHSGASWCRARLIESRVDGETSLTLEVTDDGRATCPSMGPDKGAGTGTDAGTDTDTGAAVFWGNGLTGLRERLAPLSATLTAAPVAPHGFRVTATLPVV